MYKYCISWIALAALAACSSSSLTVPFNRPQDSSLLRASATNAIVQIRVHIPLAPSNAYSISGAAKSLVAVLNGPTKLSTVASLANGAPECISSTQARICIVELHVEAGKYAATVSVYDEAPVSGRIPQGAKLLAHVEAPITVAPGSNRLPFRIGGLPNTLTITVPSASAGTTLHRSFSVVAKDASGEIITGPYDAPIRLSSSDRSGTVTIATSGSDHPPAGELISAFDRATLGYSGLAIRPVTITAVATNASSAHATFAPTLHAIVVRTSDTLNPNFIGVDLYATSGLGSSGTFTASEVGWTNSPYNKVLRVASGSGCTNIGTVNPSGTTFTATVAGAPVAGTCTLTASDPLGQSQAVTLAYTAYPFTGSAASLTLPANVTSLQVTAAGASGGGDVSSGTCPGGSGAQLSATIAVAGGASLHIQAAGAGVNSDAVSSSGAGGFGGGGNGGSLGSPGTSGGGGGGASAIFNTTAGGTPLIIAAGGGGGSGGCDAGTTAGVGGNGGNPAGGTGQFAFNASGPGGGPGGGGLPTLVGGGGSGAGGNSGTNGFGPAASSLVGSGGSGGSASGAGAGAGGGGGGGYYGGGGGGGASAGITGGAGGGGSSFPSSASFSTHTGNGFVTIVF